MRLQLPLAGNLYSNSSRREPTLCSDIVGATILAVWLYRLGSQMLREHPEHCAYVPPVEAR